MLVPSVAFVAYFTNLLHICCNFIKSYHCTLTNSYCSFYAQKPLLLESDSICQLRVIRQECRPDTRVGVFSVTTNEIERLQLLCSVARRIFRSCVRWHTLRLLASSSTSSLSQSGLVSASDKHSLFLQSAISLYKLPQWPAVLGKSQSEIEFYTFLAIKIFLMAKELILNTESRGLDAVPSRKYRAITQFDPYTVRI